MTMEYVTSRCDLRNRLLLGPVAEPTKQIKKENAHSEFKFSKIFEGKIVAIDFLPYHSFRFKSDFKKSIVDRGVIISYILTKNVDFLIIFDSSQLNNSKAELAARRGLKIVLSNYIDDCIQENELLNTSENYVCLPATKNDFSLQTMEESCAFAYDERAEEPGVIISRFSSYSTLDCPSFTMEDAVLVKYRLLSKIGSQQFCSIELQAKPAWKDPEKSLWRIEINISTRQPSFYILQHSRDALQLFEALVHSKIAGDESGNWMDITLFADEHSNLMLGSKLLKSLCFRHNIQALEKPIYKLVQDLAQAALCSLTQLMRKPINEIAASYSLDRLATAEAALLTAKRNFLNSDEAGYDEAMKDFYRQVPAIVDRQLSGLKLLARLQSLIQLIRDFLPVFEMMGEDCSEDGLLWLSLNAINGHIGILADDSSEYHSLMSLLPGEQYKVVRIWKVERFSEASHLAYSGCPSENHQLLFHASPPPNIFGILSRGLMLPRVVVDDFGGTKTDPGNLGSGIYFAPDFSTAAKYSGFSLGDRNTRFAFVSEVALGNPFLVYRSDSKLDKPPEGFNSCRSVAKHETDTPDFSDFDDVEYCIYDVRQQRLSYLIEFQFNSDPPVRASEAPIREVQLAKMEPSDKGLLGCLNTELFEDAVMEPTMAPTTSDKPVGGLIASTGKESIPLQEVHIRANLLDIVAEVVVFQRYKNSSSHAIEVRYVFPLDELAVVSGFEAYINDKHVVGQIKEKEQAHREYREAISKGHGAYLMDQDAFSPDVFQVSVGNLPPNADVIIKITYVTELTISGDEIVFSLPTSASPKVVSSGSTVQLELQSQIVSSSASVKATLQAFLDMPYEIRSLKNNKPNLPLRRKLTSTKALIEIGIDEQCTSTDLANLELRVLLSQIHTPRMWVERDVKNSDFHAAMVIFYPEFVTSEPPLCEVVIIIDMSNSMKNCWVQSVISAMSLISMLPPSCMFNVMPFGTSWSEIFPCPQRANNENKAIAFEYVRSLKPSLGSTYATAPLLSAALSFRKTSLRNVVLISDGNFSDWMKSYEILPKLVRSFGLRLFVIEPPDCQMGNRHLLRTFAALGGGVFEDLRENSVLYTSIKPTVSALVSRLKRIIQLISEPAARDVQLSWDTQASEKDILQSPNLLPAIFNHERVVAFALIPGYCNAANLIAKVDRDYDSYETTRFLSVSDMDIKTSTLIQRLASRAIIRDQDRGLMVADPTFDEAKKASMRQQIIDLSKRYGIVTKFTSFIAIEEREKDEVTAYSESHMALLQRLLDNASVDGIKNIPYESVQIGGSEIPASSGLDSIVAISRYSVSCRKYFPKGDIKKKELLPPVTEPKTKKSIKELEVTLKKMVSGSLVGKLSIDTRLGAATKKFGRKPKSPAKVRELAVPYVDEWECDEEGGGGGGGGDASELMDYYNKRVACYDTAQANFPLDSSSESSASSKSRSRDRPIDINVKTLTGKTITVAVSPADTVDTMKEKICVKEGIPPSQQRLIFDGKQAFGEAKIKDLKASNQSTFHLALRLRGGPSDGDGPAFATYSASTNSAGSVSRPMRKLMAQAVTSVGGVQLDDQLLASGDAPNFDIGMAYSPRNNNNNAQPALFPDPASMSALRESGCKTPVLLPRFQPQAAPPPPPAPVFGRGAPGKTYAKRSSTTSFRDLTAADLAPTPEPDSSVRFSGPPIPPPLPPKKTSVLAKAVPNQQQQQLKQSKRNVSLMETTLSRPSEKFIICDSHMKRSRCLTFNRREITSNSLENSESKECDDDDVELQNSSPILNRLEYSAMEMAESDDYSAFHYSKSSCRQVAEQYDGIQVRQGDLFGIVECSSYCQPFDAPEPCWVAEPVSLETEELSSPLTDEFQYLSLCVQLSGGYFKTVVTNLSAKHEKTVTLTSISSCPSLRMILINHAPELGHLSSSLDGNTRLIWQQKLNLSKPFDAPRKLRLSVKSSGFGPVSISVFEHHENATLACRDFSISKDSLENFALMSPRSFSLQLFDTVIPNINWKRLLSLQNSDGSINIPNLLSCVELHQSISNLVSMFLNYIVAAGGPSFAGFTREITLKFVSTLVTLLGVSCAILNENPQVFFVQNEAPIFSNSAHLLSDLELLAKKFTNPDSIAFANRAIAFLNNSAAVCFFTCSALGLGKTWYDFVLGSLFLEDGLVWIEDG